MKLTYPKSKNDWEDWKNRIFPEIPNTLNKSSGYKGVAVAESGLNIYVLLTNIEETEIWIEKVSKLKCRSPIYFEDLELIDTNEEFTEIYKFFEDKGILDETER